MAAKKTKKTTKRTATKTASKARAKTTKKPAKKVAARARSAGFGDALVRALTVAIVSDGEIASSERRVLDRFAKQPALRGVDVAAIVDETIDRCIADGPEPVLADVASRIKSTSDRETAFSSCLAMVATDGRATASEVRMLRALAASLRIPQARIKKLAGPLAAALG